MCHSPPYSVEAGPVTEPGAKLAARQLQSLLFAHSNAVAAGTLAPCLAFHVGSLNWGLMLAQQALLPPTASPQPSQTFHAVI